MATAPLDVQVTLRKPGAERSIYTYAAVAAIVAVFAGFAPTYYLKGAFGSPDLTTIKHVHAVVMTAWFAFFLLQVRMVATGRTALHRKLGILGVALAALVVTVGMMTAIASARAGVTPLPELSPLVFFVMPVAELAIFIVLFTAAVALRKRTDWHKRLMLLASIAMLTPAMARLPFEFVRTGGPPAFFALTDLIIVGCIVFDTVKNRRLHSAFMAGLAVVIVGQLGRVVLAQTSAWMAFARWIAG